MTITRGSALGAALALSAAISARAAEPVEIELFFPVPVQGKLAGEMQRLIGEFNTLIAARDPWCQVVPSRAVARQPGVSRPPAGRRRWGRRTA